MSVRTETDKLGRKRIKCDRRWPDGTRFRRVMPNRTSAKNTDARIHAAIAEGTWRKLREELKRGVAREEKLADFAYRYLDDYCKVYNRRWKRKLTSKSLEAVSINFSSRRNDETITEVLSRLNLIRVRSRMSWMLSEQKPFSALRLICRCG